MKERAKHAPSFFYYMDSIISNTSWAFIKSLGYDIIDFNVKSSDSDLESTITISLSPFSFVFVDIVHESVDEATNPTFATLRPIMIPSNGTAKPYSLWMVSYNDGTSRLTNSAYNSFKRLIHTITTTSTSVTLSGDYTFKRYPIYVAAYAVA